MSFVAIIKKGKNSEVFRLIFSICLKWLKAFPKVIGEGK